MINLGAFILELLVNLLCSAIWISESSSLYCIYHILCWLSPVFSYKTKHVHSPQEMSQLNCYKLLESSIYFLLSKELLLQFQELIGKYFFNDF